MAKMINCPFCGKEIKKGLFSSEQMVLVLGKGFSVDCCSECYEKYKDAVKADKNRFGIKLNNMKKATKIKLKPEEIAKLFVEYENDYQQHLIKGGLKSPHSRYACFCLADDGFFSMRETSLAFEDEDVSPKDMIKSLKKADSTGCLYFTKDDITRIEYAKVGIGSFLGLTNKAYSFNIRVNDEKVVTYKPCISRTAMLGKGFMFGYQRSAEKELLKHINKFKQHIGCDLPVVKVKKI